MAEFTKLEYQTGKLCLDKNSHNQLSISYGDYLAVSTLTHREI